MLILRSQMTVPIEKVVSTPSRSFQVPFAHTFRFSGMPSLPRKPRSLKEMVWPAKRATRGWEC
jgi:hypothetical protein